MSSGPSNLYDLASALLTAIVDEFATDQVTLPDRREITGYQVVAECDKLAVTWNRVFVGGVGAAETPMPVTRAVSRAAILSVWLFRCIWTPQGEGLQMTEAPRVEELAADAQTIMTDAYTLHRALVRAHFNGNFQGFCSGLSIGPAEPIVADGGMGGTTLQVTAELS